MHNLFERSSISTANRLAELMASDHGLRMMRLLGHLGSSRRPKANGDLLPEPPLAVKRIGIWERTVAEDGQIVYQRSGSGDSWRLWADVECIEPKAGKRRVILLGESAARGFYYDPYYNPATALGSMLNQSPGACGVEVVDLARVDCSRQTLLELAHSSLALEPDAWVIFAGNNWNPYLDLDFHHYQDIAALLGDGRSWHGMREYMEEICRNAVSAFVGEVAGLSKAHSIPVVFVIPEFNLGGWQNEFSAGVPLLDGPEATRWQDLRRSAESALANRDCTRAAELAEGMIQLDGGASPRSLEILAECKLAAGAPEEARVLLEKARDTGLSIPIRRSPRCFAVIQETLRSQAAECGVPVVDLPNLFREYLPGELPGYRLFHDYCHLTAEGIRVAMAFTAERLLPLLGLSQLCWRALSKVDAVLDAETIAEANFMAAVHNARWGQSYECIHLHCSQAVAQSPGISQTMLQFLDFYIRRAPSILCRSFENMARQNSLSAVHFLSMTSDPSREKLLNLELVTALVDVLKELSPGVEVCTQRLLEEEHGMLSGDIDLLRTSCCVRSCAEPEYGWKNRFGYFKAYGVQSEFQFISEQKAPLRLQLTCRIPGGVQAGEVIRVMINDVPVAVLEPCRPWSTSGIAVEARHVEKGRNVITIEWPQPDWQTSVHIQRIAGSLELGVVPELFPVHGEVHTFTASR